MTGFHDARRISDMTPDERLTAAAIIMRDGIEKSLYERALREAAERDAIEKHDAEVALRSAESPRNSQQTT
ncbi:hypothetical protein QE392_002352 [Microbacterium proteolyticum]|uniref:hypothetical protein n=2 Tax=Microbacterium TaxID=33882 RepID=UPI002781A93F|nr:hypothetical protein [Microbacterium proteolyticum]MDQ1170548.1 hypothetical protein [Microbacterium proteolyticum]